MGVTHRRLDPAMTEQPADDREPLAEREHLRREGVPDVMDAYGRGVRRARGWMPMTRRCRSCACPASLPE